MKTVLAIVVSHSFNQAVFAGHRFLVAVYVVQQGAPPMVVGVLIALFSLAPVFFTVPVGKLVDRIGTRAPMQVSLALMTAATLLPCFWPGLAPLYITAPLVGGAFFGCYVGMSTLLNHYSTPENRPGNFARMSVGISVAQGLVPLIGGFSVDHLGYVPAFGMVTLYALCSYLVFTLGGVKHIGPGTQREAAVDKLADKSAANPAAKTRTLDLLRNRDLLSVFVFSTLFILAWDIFLVMMPIYGTELGLTASQMGVVMSAYGVASFAVRVAGPWLSRRYSPWQLMHIALVMCAVSTMVFGMLSTMPLLLLCAFVMGMGQGIGSPMSSAAMYEVAPKERVGEALGVRMSLGMAAQTVLPLGVGAMGALLAAAPIFWVSGLILFGGVVTERGQWKRKRPGTS